MVPVVSVRILVIAMVSIVALVVVTVVVLAQGLVAAAVVTDPLAGGHNKRFLPCPSHPSTSLPEYYHNIPLYSLHNEGIFI